MSSQKSLFSWALGVFVFIMIFPAHAEKLTPLEPGSAGYFPTGLECPANGATGTLESVQSKRDGRRIMYQVVFSSGQPRALKFFAAIANEDFLLTIDHLHGSPLDNELKGTLEKATHQAAVLLKEVCQNTQSAKDQFFRMLKTNKRILTGELKED